MKHNPWRIWAMVPFTIISVQIGRFGGSTLQTVAIILSIGLLLLQVTSLIMMVRWDKREEATW